MNSPYSIHGAKGFFDYSGIRSNPSLPAIEVTEQDLDVLERAAAILKELANTKNELAIAKPVTESALLECARFVYQARCETRTILQNPHVADGPAWDILLDLFISEGADRSVAVSDALIAAGCPPTTGLRWVQVLHEAGLIEREKDRADNRRTYLKLSELGRCQVRAALCAYMT